MSRLWFMAMKLFLGLLCQEISHVQRGGGTRKIGAAAKQAPKKVARPLQNAFKSTKAKAKPTPKRGASGGKGGGGLFGFKAPSPKQV